MDAKQKKIVVDQIIDLFKRNLDCYHIAVELDITMEQIIEIMDSLRLPEIKPFQDEHIFQKLIMPIEESGIDPKICSCLKEQHINFIWQILVFQSNYFYGCFGDIEDAVPQLERIITAWGMCFESEFTGEQLACLKAATTEKK